MTLNLRKGTNKSPCTSALIKTWGTGNKFADRLVTVAPICQNAWQGWVFRVFFSFISDFFTTFLSIDPRWSPEELQQKWGHHMSVRERERKKWETINYFGYKRGICYMLQKIGKVKHMGTRGPKGTPLASQEWWDSNCSEPTVSEHPSTNPTPPGQPEAMPPRPMPTCPLVQFWSMLQSKTNIGWIKLLVVNFTSKRPISIV